MGVTKYYQMKELEEEQSEEELQEQRLERYALEEEQKEKDCEEIWEKREIDRLIEEEYFKGK